MLQDDEAGSSARSEQAEISTRTPSSYQEAMALERCQHKAARKADAFFHDCDQNASEPSGTPSSYEEAMALERRSEKKHQTVAKPAKSSGSWAEEWNLLRKCGTCGEKGHYRTTCPTNPDVPPRPVKRRKSTTTKASFNNTSFILSSPCQGLNDRESRVHCFLFTRASSSNRTSLHWPHPL